MTIQQSTQLLYASHIVDGRRQCPRSGNDLVICDAPDGAPSFAVAQAESSDIDAAVSVATEAFREWKRTPTRTRSAILRDASARIRHELTTIAPIIVRETGKPLAQARGEVNRASQALGDAADFASALAGRVLHDQSASVWGMELQEPRGPSVIVNAWNMPLQLAAIKVGAALAAGCSVILKPSPYAPLSVEYLHSALIKSGLPTGCLTILQGGASVVSGLALHPDVKVVSVTGSDSTGREVMRHASGSLKKMVLELGGKSANIVLADADIPLAVRGIISGFTRNQGAACTAATRILVERPVLEQVVHGVAMALETLKVGDPFTDVQVGALRGLDVMERLQSCLTEAVEQGGHVVGGSVVDVTGRTGSYMRPAAVLGLTNDAPIAQVEHFGPIATIIAVDSIDEAIDVANSSRYGLAAGVWSTSLPTLQHVWRELNVGTVFVNSYNRIDGIPLPAEGRSNSGFGAENGAAGLREFMCHKSVHFPLP